MNDSHHVTWNDGSTTNTAIWQSEAGRPPPSTIFAVDDTTTADAAYHRACAGTGLIYSGDFQNAKQLLQAMTRRVDRKPAKPGDTLLQTFHQHRVWQIGRSSITNKLLIPLHYGRCELSRAPELQEAVEAALGEPAPARLLLSLREILGMVGAHEWRKNGVHVDALNARIHAHYGVYSPIRGEYLNLINVAPLNDPQVAWDIGTGTGVIAAVLARRGVNKIVATDNNPRALICAAENVERLRMDAKVEVVETSLFPEGTADLIVCNPPWIPAKANTAIERAVYDPKSQMLRGFLSGVSKHLNANGHAWLVMSNLAEHIGLRSPTELQDWISQAGLELIEKHDTTPTHGKAADRSDPLHEARSQEVTSLYRLAKKSTA